MLKGGVIMDVVTPEQARIAEEAGAVAVMALERVPADIRRDGGVARMSDPDMIDGIIDAVSIPVMAKAASATSSRRRSCSRSASTTSTSPRCSPRPTRPPHRQVALRRAVRVRRHQPRRGAAAPVRGRGDDPLQGRGRDRQRRRGDPAHALDHRGDPPLSTMDETELYAAAKEHRAPVELVREVAETGRLPVVLFTAGGIATPADAAMMMQLGADGVFVGSGIFKSGNPEQRARAIVEATTHFEDPGDRQGLARARRGDGRHQPSRPADRGW
jgi:pyridoxal 5'-phosphate synthase pdxS subunit